MPSAIVKERPRSTFPKGFLAIRTMFFLTHKVEHLTSALPVRSMLWPFVFWAADLDLLRFLGHPQTHQEFRKGAVLRLKSWWGEQPTAFFSFSANAWLADFMGKWHSPQNECGKSEGASNYMKRLADHSQKDWACWVDLVMVCLQVGWLMASRNAACFGMLFVAELRVKSGLDLDAQKSLLAGLPFPNYQ